MNKTRSESAYQRPEYRDVLHVLGEDNDVFKKSEADADSEGVRDQRRTVVRYHYGKIEDFLSS